MSLFLPARRALALAACASLLVCQTAVAAAGWGLAPAAEEESAASAPAHRAVPHCGDTSELVQPQHCLAGHGSPNLAKLDVPQADDFPALRVKLAPLRAPLRNALNACGPPARAEPPTLNILYSCLRN